MMDDVFYGGCSEENYEDRQAWLEYDSFGGERRGFGDAFLRVSFCSVHQRPSTVINLGYYALLSVSLCTAFS